MSDLSIPGVGTSKYGTEKLIEGLMKLERVPRDKAAERVKALDIQKSAWLDVNQRLTSLRESARSLYSFKNPFSERVAKSSDEDSVSATATREALEQTRTVVVKRPAAADRFLSAELAKEYKVAEGTYTFTVGDKSIELRYGGGSLQDFADALTRKGRDLLRAQVISVKPDTKSLVIESLKTGAQNRLGFAGDAEKLALSTGILEKVASSKRELDPTKPAAWTRALDPALVKVDAGGFLSLVAGTSAAEAKLPIQPSVKAAGMVLELEYRLARLPREAAPTAPPGPSIGPTGSITYEGVSVQGAPSATGLPEWVAPSPPPIVEDKAMASLLGPEGRAVALPELQDGEGTQTLRVALSDYLPEAGALAFRVRDTTRRLEVLRARVLDPAETGGYRPLRPVSTAQDALFSVDGIEATRPSNDVSDIIPGVTLNIKAATDKPAKLRIEPDREAAQEAVIKLVGGYNRLMGQINILTRADEAIITELDYLTDDERKTAKERLGLMQGDSTLSLLRSSLQRAMTDAYETKDGNELALLSQIGVASNARAPGSVSGYDKTKMRGYLEIDEDTLKKAVADHFEAVRQLFGNDTDGDLLVNTGVAYVLDSTLKPYVETGGIIALKTSTIDAQRAREQTSIETMDRQLAAKEAELKRKYGLMEGALNRMEGTAGSIDNFNKQQSGN
jgi:flagellar hook-associated protein 2